MQARSLWTLLLLGVLGSGCGESGKPTPIRPWTARILDVAGFQRDINSIALDAREDEHHVAKLRRLLDEQVETEVQRGAVCAVVVKLAEIGQSRPEYLELARQLDEASERNDHFCEIHISQYYPIGEVWPNLRTIAGDANLDANIRRHALLVSGWLEGWESHPQRSDFESMLWTLVESDEEPTLRMQALLALVKTGLASPEETRHNADEIAAEDPEVFGREGPQREIRSTWP